MLLYDQGASVDWFYAGTQTFDEMRSDPLHKALTEVPCVLYDNGAGKAYSFEPLETACVRWAVPCTGSPAQDFGSLTAMMEGTYKAPGVAEAQQTADEAKAIAEQAGTDPQLQALATMQVATMDLTSYSASQAASFRDYWPEWQEGVSYKQNDCVRYDGRYWRVSQDTTSQGIYPPGTSESLYYEVELAPDGIIVYRPCHGEYDMVRAGETRHYPDAEGPVYLAKVDTAYDPDTVPGNWELAE